MSAVHAAEAPFSLGGVYAYGDRTHVYGVQAAWAPQNENEFFASYDLGLRLAAQVARWVASESHAQHDSLIDGSVTAELRYWLLPERSVRPFAEAGLGLHLMSHTHIANQGLGVACGFGTQVALGTTFGDSGRYEIAALAHHVSNGSIKQPNEGINYFGIRVRVALP